MRKVYSKAVIETIITLFSLGCMQQDVQHRYSFPEYTVQMVVEKDTISYKFNDNMFNKIKSYNYFVQHNTDYISFYDRQSQSINFYDFLSCKSIKRILLKDCFKGRDLYKTTVFAKNFDSVFINNKNCLYLIDSAGKIKDSVNFQTDPYFALASFSNGTPAIINGGQLYTEARPRLYYTKKRDLQKWRVLYQFDMSSKKANMSYRLPKIYLTNLYAYSYFDNSYCYNDKGRFVYSFPADTNIYETNLAEYNISYNGKSKFQSGEIQPIAPKEFKEGANEIRYFLTNDSYSDIYFDPFTKRYLRVAKRKMSLEEFRSKEWKRQQSLIIFDENFKITGEVPIDININLSSLFITRDGKIYARTNAKDNTAIHLIRLTYKS